MKFEFVHAWQYFSIDIFFPSKDHCDLLLFLDGVPGLPLGAKNATWWQIFELLVPFIHNKMPDDIQSFVSLWNAVALDARRVKCCLSVIINESRVANLSYFLQLKISGNPDK